jgi:GxxExxY protein
MLMDFKARNYLMDHEDLSGQIIGCAIEVHKQLGPGLLESTYEQCLAHELAAHHLPFRLQAPVSVRYKGICLDCGYRVDCLVDNRIILELKSVERLKAIHEAQLLTYMKLAQVNVGLLINFNVLALKNGIK